MNNRPNSQRKLSQVEKEKRIQRNRTFQDYLLYLILFKDFLKKNQNQMD